MTPTLLVLAAGLSSRYGGLKQIVPVGPNGEAILDYSVYDAVRAGFGKLVFVIRKEIEQVFRDAVGSRFEAHIEVDYVFQELNMLPSAYQVPAGRTKPWGTTHAVLMAEHVIREPFAVINADDFYGAGGYRELAEHLVSGTSDYAMVGFILRNTLSEFGTVSRGLCQIGSSNYLRSIVELSSIERDDGHARNMEPDGKVTTLTGDELVSMNMWGFTPAVFEQFQGFFREFLERSGSELKSEAYLPTAVNQLIAARQARVKALFTHDSWCGVTYREDHTQVVNFIHSLVEAGRYPARLWQ
jgi:NDP-sugar pyrophosphorylase family protein